ncbi:MAG: hypothetical protein ABJA94_08555, partial [Rhodoglobus sp.]
MTVDLRLGIPGVAAWVAAGVVIGVPSIALPVAVGLWLAAAVLVVVAVRLRWVAIVALAIVAAALCCTAIAIQSPARFPASLSEDAHAGRHISGTATTTATLLPGRGNFAATLASVDGVAVSVPVLVFGDHPVGRIGIGTTIAIAGTLTAAEPGDDVSYLFFADDPPTVVAAPPWYLDWANGLRAGFLHAA